MLVDGRIVGLGQLLSCAPPEVEWEGFSPLPPDLRAAPAARHLEELAIDAANESGPKDLMKRRHYVPPEVEEYKAKIAAAARAAREVAPKPQLTEDDDDLVDFVPSSIGSKRS